jgi:hypothetical protein
MFVLIKESHEKLEWIKLFNDISNARKALINEYINVNIIGASYKSQGINHDIIFDINTNTYIKLHIEEIEVT